MPPVSFLPHQSVDIAPPAAIPAATHPITPLSAAAHLASPREQRAAPGRRHNSMEAFIRNALAPGKGTGALEEIELQDMSTSAKQEHQHPQNHFATIDGAGFALKGKRIFSWNNGTGSWDRMPQRDIAAIGLGADGHGYACTADSKLLCLTGPRAGRAVDLTAGAVFAASPTGHIASLAGGEAGQPRCIQVAQPTGKHGDAINAALPLPPGGARVSALAYASDGKLHVLTDDGQLWRTLSGNVANTTGIIWDRLPMCPGERITSLFTLPENGAIGICSQDGSNQHLLEKNATWTAHAPDAPTGLERTYGQLRDSQQKWSNVTLGSPFTPGSARSDKKDLSWWQSKMAVFAPEKEMHLVPRGEADLNQDLPEASLAARYLNYFKAHYLPGPAAAAPHKVSPQNQLRDEYAALLALPPTAPPTTAPDPALGLAVHANAAMALDRIERALGMTDANGVLNPHWRDSDAVRAAQVGKGRAGTSDNMLFALLQRRTALLPAAGSAGNDPHVADTTARLQRLVDAGVHLERPLPARAPRAAQGYRALPARMFDTSADTLNALRQPASQGLDILAAQLVKDQLCFEQALQRPSSTAADLRADLARVNGSDGNLVSQRFKQNIWDARSEVVFDSMRTILAGFGQRDHVLNRAARFQGTLGADHAKDYVRMVAELAPGESIKFEHTWQAGLDGDGWSHNWTPADRFKEGAHPDVKTPADLKGRFNIAFNKVPNILPVPGGSLAHTRSMTITKRADGIDISFGNAFEGEVKLLCAKIKWGAGEYAANKRTTAAGKESHSSLGLVFFGLEVVPALLVFSKGSDNSVKLSLQNSETGTVDHVLDQLLSGRLTAEQLLDGAAFASYTRSTHSKWSNTLDLQGLIAVVGIFTPPEKLYQRFKMVAAAVEQWTASLNFSKSESRAQDATGVTTSSTGSNAMAGLNRKFISVTEVQGSWLKALPAFSTLLGKTKDITIGDGYEMEHKVPTWIDLQIMDVFAPKALHHTPTVQQQADGSVTKLSYNISSKEALNFEALPHWRELAGHSPEIAANLRGAAEKAHAQGLTVSVEMELLPAHLALLNESRERKQEPGLADDLSALVRNAASWRPARLVVAGSEQYNTALVVGASAGRYKSHASNTHHTNLALIEITYDDSNEQAAKPLRAAVRGPLTNGGGRPQFGQLDALTQPALVDAIYGVGDERSNGPRRRLASLPDNGPDAADLARLGAELLAAPIAQPHVALAKGRPVLQFQHSDGRWRQVELLHSECLQLLGPHRSDVDPQALLQLMQAKASGRLRLEPGPLAALADGERARLQPASTRVSAGRAPERPLGIVALLEHADHLGGGLDIAQEHVLATFFPGDDGPVRARQVAQNPDMMAALSHALRLASNEALAQSAAHDTPSVELQAESKPAAGMMPSGAMASASA